MRVNPRRVDNTGVARLTQASGRQQPEIPADIGLLTDIDFLIESGAMIDAPIHTSIESRRRGTAQVAPEWNRFSFRGVVPRTGAPSQSRQQVRRRRTRTVRRSKWRHAAERRK